MSELSAEDLAREVPAVKVEVASLSRWRGYIMGSIAVVVAAVVSFALTSREVDARADERIGTNEGDIVEIRDDVDSLDDQLHQTREEILKAVADEATATRARVSRADRDRLNVEAIESKLSRPDRREFRRLLESANQ